MTQSESIGKLGEALCKAQSIMMAAVKDSVNPFYKSKYADLSSVWEAVREPLTKNGLSVVQQTISNGDQVGIATILIHTSGEWIKSEIFAKPVKPDPQGIGSCLTYLRRYSLSAMVGVCPEDDDGNGASRRLKAEPEDEDQRSVHPASMVDNNQPDTYWTFQREGKTVVGVMQGKVLTEKLLDGAGFVRGKKEPHKWYAPFSDDVVAFLKEARHV
jgi:hypothetical protein